LHKKICPVISVRPKIAELVYQLYGRSLHPELFDIHQTRTVERGAYKATVQITSAGHLVAWQYRGLMLTEVAAGAHHPLPQRRRLMSYRLKGERTDRLEIRAGVSYEMKKIRGLPARANAAGHAPGHAAAICAERPLRYRRLKLCEHRLAGQGALRAGVSHLSRRLRGAEDSVVVPDGCEFLMEFDARF
jgi:hypothetical protein